MDQSKLEWCYLKSYADAPDQPTHRDFAVSRYIIDPMDVASLPSSLLIATQDDTVVYGYSWNHHVAFQSDQVVIRLQKGDLLFMRGDFIHSRAGYTWNNLCIHTFLGEITTRPHFRGQLVPCYDDKPTVNAHDGTCYVLGCRFVGNTDHALRMHLRSCHNVFIQSFSRCARSNDPRIAVAEAEIINLADDF
ncbi:hypothetical protein F441_19089 [Phytophthora nicotianae CJ01A1]|uniref:Uncharacterized protein n=1 Tax=Phytophthora nicotianae CJ01A1 TaxID=1317063 RepID=W2W0E1_PHYNI|nr:hypothetical protein F441_19089 [Phytophthora nicotianae CJ01A1]